MEVAEKVGCSAPFISKWKRRFVAEGLAGLYNRHRGRPVSVLTPKVEARILNWTRKKPTDGSTHWSTRRLATKLGVHHMMVARVWKKHGLQPHRMERYMASNDPNFEDKAADVIGLYLKPPQNAVVFCVDEKTAIQALDRKDPVLPLSPGRAERHGFEYVRHGTLSLYAAFDTQTGAVLGKTAARHTSQEFVAFLSDLVAQQAEGPRDPRHLRQPIGPQNSARERVPRGPSDRSHALHPDLLILAQSGRTLVLQDRTRSHLPRRLHLDQAARTRHHDLHPQVQPKPQTREVALRQPSKTYPRH